MADNVNVGSFLRTPIGLFAATLVVGLVLIAVGMKAYDGASPPPAPQLSPAAAKAKFQHAAMHICLSSRALVKGLKARGKPHSLRAIASTFHWMTPRVDSLTREIDGLVPPGFHPRTAAKLRRLDRKINRFDRALDHLDHFAETHQWGRFVRLARSPGFKRLGKQFGSSRKHRKMRCDRADPNIA